MSTSTVESAKDGLSTVSPLVKVLGIGAAFLGGPAILYYLLKPKPPYKRDFENGKVYVYQYFRTPMIPSLSARCLSLETYLRIAKIRYENVVKNPWVRAANGQCLPFVELNGAEISDPKSVIKKLIDKLNIVDPTADVQSKTKEVDVEKCVEDLIWCLDYFRYDSKNCKDLFSERISGKQSASVPVAPHSRQIMVQMMFSGDQAFRFGDRKKIAFSIEVYMKEKINNYFQAKNIVPTCSNIVLLAAKQLSVLSESIGTERFFLASKASSIDAKVFGIIAQILYVPLESPLERIVLTEYSNLVSFCENIRIDYWSDWAEILQTGKMDTKPCHHTTINFWKMDVIKSKQSAWSIKFCLLEAKDDY